MSRSKGVMAGNLSLHDVSAVHVSSRESEGTRWQSIQLDMGNNSFFELTVFPSADARLLPETPDVVTNAIEIGDPTGVIDTAP